MSATLEAKYIIRGDANTEAVQAFARDVLHMSPENAKKVKPGHDISDYLYQGDYTAETEPPFQMVQINWVPQKIK